MYGSGREESRYFSAQRWESSAHKTWGLPARGLQVACGWSVVQLDHDEELGPMHWMYGTLEAGPEVQRTIKRAELMALLCLLRKVIGPTMVHVEKMNH